MAAIDKIRILDFSSMDGAERLVWTKRLCNLQENIFDGARDFEDYVINSKAEETKIAVFQDGGVPVGYCAAHRFLKRLEGRKVVVFRAEAGLLKQYRGRNRTFPFGFRAALRYRFSHPLKELYYLGTFVHPSIYRLMTKYFDEIYPNCRYPVPPEIKRLMCALADGFHVPPVDPGNPMIRKAGWITKASKKERDFWAGCSQSDARFFISANPGYAEGDGLLTLIPLGFSNLCKALLRYAGWKKKAIKNKRKVEKMRVDCGR